MRRVLNEKEIEVLGDGYRLMKDNVVVLVEKYPYSHKIYKVYRPGEEDNPHSEVYSTFNLMRLAGMFDGYFKGLNKVLGDTRKWKKQS